MSATVKSARPATSHTYSGQCARADSMNDNPLDDGTDTAGEALMRIAPEV